VMRAPCIDRARAYGLFTTPIAAGGEGRGAALSDTLSHASVRLTAIGDVNERRGAPIRSVAESVCELAHNSRRHCQARCQHEWGLSEARTGLADRRRPDPHYWVGIDRARLLAWGGLIAGQGCSIVTLHLRASWPFIMMLSISVT
jgi:hypothetical protein